MAAVFRFGLLALVLQAATSAQPAPASQTVGSQPGEEQLAKLDKQADALRHAGDLAAERSLRLQCLERTKQLYGPRHWRTADARLALKETEQWARLPEAARADLCKAEQLLAHVDELFAEHKLAEAEQAAREALERSEKAHGKQASRQRGAALQDLAVLHREQAISTSGPARVQQLRAAETCLRDSYAIRSQIYVDPDYPDGHPDLAQSELSLGSLLVFTGRRDEGRQNIEKALKRYRGFYPGGHDQAADCLLELGMMALVDKDNTLGTKRLREAIGMLSSLHPRGHENLGNLHVILGRTYQAEGDDQQAAAEFEQALTEYDKAPPARTAMLVELLEVLAALRHSLGDGARALDAARRTERLSRTFWPKYTSARAKALHLLALHLNSMGDPQQGLPYCVAALRMRQCLYPRDTYPDGHPDIADSLQARGMLQRFLKPGAAVADLRESLTMWERLYGAGPHRELAQVRYNLGRILLDEQRMGEAEKLLRESIATYRACLRGGPDRDVSDGLALALRTLGELLQARRDIVGAENVGREAHQLLLTLYPSTKFPHGHPLLGLSFNDLGVLSFEEGRHAEARQQLRRAVEVAEHFWPRERFPEGHPDLITSLRNLGELLIKQGDLRAGRATLERCWEMADILYAPRNYPNGHPDRALCLDTLGATYYLEGEFGRARQCLLSSLEQYEKLYPTERHPQGHLLLVRGLSNAAGVLAATGDLQGACSLLERAAKICAYFGEAGAVDLTRVMNHRGVAEMVNGRLDEAESDFRESLAARRRLYSRDRCPTGHPDLALGLHNLGHVLLVRGKYREATEVLTEACTMYQDLFEAYAVGLSWAEALNLRDSLPATRDDLLEASRHLGGDARQQYSVVWRTKAVVTRLLLRRQTAPVGATAELWGKYHGACARLANSALAPHDPRAPEVRVEQLRQLTEDKEALERQLDANDTVHGRERELNRLAPEQLLKALDHLPVSVAFIDLIAYDRPPAGPNGTAWPGAPSERAYVAFVLMQGRVHRVELGPAAPIDRAVLDWCSAIRAQVHVPNVDPRPHSSLVELWGRLATALGERTPQVLFIAPDGALARLPWGALPARDGSLLIEHSATAVVPHGPFLFDVLTRKRPSPFAETVLLAGDPDYEHRPAVASMDQRDLGPQRTWQSRSGFARELEVTGDLVRGAGRRLVLLAGKAATTGSLLAALPEATCAIIVTHGFADDRPDYLRLGAVLAGSTAGALPTLPALAVGPFLTVVRFEGELAQPLFLGRGRYSPVRRNPLLTTGLVMAGANRPVRVGTDNYPEGSSYLSGAVLAPLPLPGLDWVALPECFTGEGSMVEGEGLFGLRLAFHLAGARTVLSHLWEADDLIAQRLMEAFCAGVFTRGEGKLASLITAQRALLARKGGKSDSQLLYYWAGWQLSGDPGDLSGLAEALAAPSAMVAANTPVSLSGDEEGLALWLGLAALIVAGAVVGWWWRMRGRGLRAR